MRAVLSPEARRDLREILIWSENHFGRKAAERYDALLKQALRDIESNPQRMGSQEREELAESIHTYHIRYSRERARSNLGIVRNPRHIVVYRRHKKGVIEVMRVLHDSRDLERHLPEDHA